MDIIKEITNYVPFDEQENKDKKVFLEFINNFEDILTRNNNYGHFTASAFVINKEKNKMVLVYHLINDGWMYPGGHADGEEDLLSVAVREVKEETGLDVKILDNNIFAIQAIIVPNHIKRGEYVKSHIHYDVVYLMEADDNSPLFYRPDESKGVKWIKLEDSSNDEIVQSFRQINNKLVKKLKKLIIF